MTTKASKFKESLENAKNITGRLTSGFKFECRIKQVLGDYLIVSNLKEHCVNNEKFDTAIRVEVVTGDEVNIRIDSIEYFKKLDNDFN